MKYSIRDRQLLGQKKLYYIEWFKKKKLMLLQFVPYLRSHKEKKRTMKTLVENGNRGAVENAAGVPWTPLFRARVKATTTYFS